MIYNRERDKKAMGWINASWPAPPNVRAGTTTRYEGYSLGQYAHFNVGDHVGDNPTAVAANRAKLKAMLGLTVEPCWLQQIHGNRLVEAQSTYQAPPTADGSYTQQCHRIPVVVTADCLPILLCNTAGTFVAALHGGWRSLANGIITSAVQQAIYCNIAPQHLLVWLGPAIGPEVFQVGAEVRHTFLQNQPFLAEAFQADGKTRYVASLYHIARQQCNALGITDIYGGHYCTYSDNHHFYSYRRHKNTGRMASLIWLTTSYL
ncbi:MAG: peptidoglycan editing factor PgeF [Gammaproteobacteria bacterium]